MGVLIPVEHATRIDAPRASRLVRALGCAWVRAGYRPRTIDEIDRVIAALVPDRETTVTFSNGGLALDELEHVAFGGGFAYTDVRTDRANVRVWPELAWLHVANLPPGGLAEATAAVREHLGVDVPPEPGKHVRGTIEVSFQTPHLAIDIASPDRAPVYRLFRAFAGGETDRGFVMTPGAGAIAALPAYLRRSAATVTIDAEISPEVAAELCATVPATGWQADDMTYAPATGVIATERLLPVPDEQIDDWTARIDEALGRT